MHGKNSQQVGERPRCQRPISYAPPEIADFTPNALSLADCDGVVNILTWHLLGQAGVRYK